MAGMKLRPRFSVRTLVIIVTLVCIYLGAWQITRKYGINDQMWVRGTIGNTHVYERSRAEVSCPAPFLIRVDESKGKERTWLFWFGKYFHLIKGRQPVSDPFG
jgi:hypothetical protein